MEQPMRVTKVFERIDKHLEHKRYAVCYGGSSSSKTISILQWLVIYAFRNNNKRIVLSAESIPKLKKTLLADLRSVVMPNIWNEANFNKSELIYTFPNKTTMAFVSADEPQRFRGMRQDVIYFDELSDIPEEVYVQADIRTKDKVLSSFNPVASFWITNYWNNEDYYVDHSTYKDNPHLSKSIVGALESKTDPNFRRVYIEGKWGTLEGLIFEEGTNWEIVPELPKLYNARRLGLDFGYSKDPNAIVDVRYYNGELWLKEVAYKGGLINSEIAKVIDGYCRNCKVVADSAEPKSIEELRRLGVLTYPALKGKDSVNAGLNLMKEFKLNVTEDSLNLINELRNYSWAKDREGNQLNKPIDTFNHLIDATRYTVLDLLHSKVIKFL